MAPADAHTHARDEQPICALTVARTTELRRPVMHRIAFCERPPAMGPTPRWRIWGIFHLNHGEPLDDAPRQLIGQ